MEKIYRGRENKKDISNEQPAPKHSNLIVQFVDAAEKQVI